jgi:hydrogenase maturation factor
MHDPTEGGVATGLYELATASNVGLEIDSETLSSAPETTRLCAEFDLDPLGVISSGALLIGCEADSTDALLSALNAQDISATRIGVVRDSSFGLQLTRDGLLSPLPTFATDEITRLFS